MKASVEWLKEYSDIDVDSIKLGDILTMTGSKVETIEQKGNDIKNPIQEGQFRKYTEPIKLVTRTGEMITLITKDSLGNEKYYYYYPEVQFSTRNVMSGETYYKQTGNLNLNNVGDRVTYKIVSNVKTKLVYLNKS